MPGRQTWLSCTEGSAKEPAAASNIPTWLSQLGGPAGGETLGSFVLTAFFFFSSSLSLFIMCNFKSGIPRGVKDVVHPCCLLDTAQGSALTVTSRDTSRQGWFRRESSFLRRVPGISSFVPSFVSLQGFWREQQTLLCSGRI